MAIEMKLYNLRCAVDVAFKDGDFASARRLMAEHDALLLATHTVKEA